MTIDVAAYLRDMQEARTEFPRAARAVVSQLADYAAQQAARSPVFKDRSGGLRANIFMRPDGDDFAVIADKFYAFWVQNGRGPVVAGSKTIQVFGAGAGDRSLRRKATGRKMLRFVIGGQVFFRRSVRAAAPRPFMPDGNTNDGELDLELEAIANATLSPLWE